MYEHNKWILPKFANVAPHVMAPHSVQKLSETVSNWRTCPGARKFGRHPPFPPPGTSYVLLPWGALKGGKTQNGRGVQSSLSLCLCERECVEGNKMHPVMKFACQKLFFHCWVLYSWPGTGPIRGYCVQDWGIFAPCGEGEKEGETSFNSSAELQKVKLCNASFPGVLLQDLLVISQFVTREKGCSVCKCF